MRRARVVARCVAYTRDRRTRLPGGWTVGRAMNKRMRFTLIGLCISLPALWRPLALAGLPQQMADSGTTASSGMVIHLPLAMQRWCVQHRAGDWIVDGHESLEHCSVTLDGDLRIRSGATLRISDSMLRLSQGAKGLSGIYAEPGSTLIIERSHIGPSAPEGLLAFVVDGASFALRQSTLENLSDRNREPYRGGLQLKHVSGAVVQGNTFNHEEWFGIWLTDCTETLITDNTFDCSGPSGVSGAIYLERSHRNTITHNRLWHQWDALHLFSSWDNTITHNQVTLSDHTIGISLWYASGNNLVAYNDIAADEGAFA